MLITLLFIGILFLILINLIKSLSLFYLLHQHNLYTPGLFMDILLYCLSLILGLLILVDRLGQKVS